MSYLHCHTKYCGWSQDDFWSFDWKGLYKVFKVWRWSSRPFGYNPISLILEDIASYIKPRFIEWDSMYAKEKGYSQKEFSWKIMVRSIKNHFLRIFKQKWWTFKSFQKEYDKEVAKCPKCGLMNFDID